MYPEKWLEQMKDLLGTEYDDFVGALEKSAGAGMRINALHGEASFRAAAAYAGEPVPWYPEYGRYVKGGRPGADIAHTAGAYYMQEPSAMGAVAALAPQKGEIILDLCAAPGGKSGQIAQAIGESGALVSNEVESSRARMLAGNLERLGVSNAAVVSAMPDVLAAQWPETFDAVLCDAPCSGEGMFRRDPAARDQWNEKSPEGCAARQRTILESAAAMVRPGGRLLYSTCTFNSLENEGNIVWFLETHPEWHAASFALAGIGESRNGCIRLWPHKLDGEGHFVALLYKDEGRIARDNKKKKGGRKDNGNDAIKGLERLMTDHHLLLEDRLTNAAAELMEDTVLLVPKKMPSTAGIYCLRRGVPAGKLGRSHTEPDHSLAMALRLGECTESEALTDEEVTRYLAGESMEGGSGKGFSIVRWHDLPLGWVKKGDGLMKNRLPKGLWQRYL